MALRDDERETSTLIFNKIERNKLYELDMDESRILFIDTRPENGETYIYVRPKKDITDNIILKHIATTIDNIITVSEGFNYEKGHDAFLEWIADHLSNETDLFDINHHISGFILPKEGTVLGLAEQILISINALQEDY